MSRLSPDGDVSRPAGEAVAEPIAVPDDTGSAADPVAGKSVAEILGEIVWLMTQDPTARELPIREIERLVMPAILSRRFHIHYVRMGPTGSKLQPLSVEFPGAELKDGEAKVGVRFGLSDKDQCPK